MTVLKVLLTVVFLIICLGLVVIVLLQEGKNAGLGSLSGSADTFWGKNKGRSMEGKLEKITKYGVALFMVLALILNMF